MIRIHILFWLTFVASATAADDTNNTAFFESKIRSILVSNCYECHSLEKGKSKGGLTLDTRDGIRVGGDTGPAVVPGDAGKSLLLTAIKHADPDLEMPPKKPQLSPAVIADFEMWIRNGAPDSRTSQTIAAKRSPVDLASGKQFWSYRKPVPRAVPIVKQTTWPLSNIDRFVLARLESENLEPSPDASATIFLRRLYFDLIGLPPTPRQAAEFTMEKLETTVDELLASKEFGVRWGRHWLDVARYAESNGRESNLVFPHAWRYRDYVIDAVNADIPFDRFLTEQIAGDLLPAANDTERARLLIATGFLAMGTKGLNEMNKAQFAADLADEQLDTVSRAFLATSIACARCHDHKTDPFSMEDYYGLAGIFKSTRTFFGTWIDSENNNSSHLIRLPRLPGEVIPNKPVTPQRVAQLKADLAKLDAEEKEQQEYAARAKAEKRDISGEYFKMLQTAIRIYWTRGGIEGQLETVDDEGQALPLCMGVQDAARMIDSPLYERGDITHPGKAIPRGFPRLIEIEIAIPSERSGRLEFSRWLASQDNPLTARVMVNRVWHHLFGTGLVQTVDNFGFTGERPSHPELLDHLALQFVSHGWSVKSLIREIVLSRTYRQASNYRQDAFEKDPDNRLLWRTNKRRMDAEVLRDSMLAVSGLLDASRRPGSLAAELGSQSVSLIGFNDKLPTDLDGSHRRSIYLPVIRDHLPDVLEQFDMANPNLVTGSRDVTNVPLQALYLMNGPFVQEQADALAERTSKGRSTSQEHIRRAFVLCFNRPPDRQEMELAESFLKSAHGNESQRLRAFCQALLASAEFRYID